MYRQAYDSQHLDLSRLGTNAAIALWQFDLLAEEHQQTRQIANSLLERTFFSIGDECNRANKKMWNFTGNQSKRYPLASMAWGAIGGLTTTLTLFYLLQ